MAPQTLHNPSVRSRRVYNNIIFLGHGCTVRSVAQQNESKSERIEWAFKTRRLRSVFIQASPGVPGQDVNDEAERALAD